MLRILIYIAIGVLLIFGYVRYIESRSLFYPLKNVEYRPDDIGLSFENIYLKTQDNVQINGWFIPCNNAKYTILFFHGNAGNIGHRLDKIKMLHDINVNVFIIDYRGYGNSSGKPSEQGFYDDAMAAYNYLISSCHIKPIEVIVYGESIGSAVAIYLASKVEVGALIVEGVFSSGRDLGRVYYPFIPSFFFSDKFNSLAKIKKVNAPKLFIHSKTDTTIPFSLAKKLYIKADSPKQLIELSGGHNDAFLDSKEKYISSIASFIKELN